MHSLRGRLVSGLIFAASLLSAFSQSYVWVNTAGSSVNDSVCGVGQDSAGNSYIGGTFTGTFAFHSTTLNSAGGTDIFVAKYNANGDFAWARQAGGIGDDDVAGIAVTAGGDIVLTGGILGNATFDTTNLPATNRRMYIARYNTSGDLAWAQIVNRGNQYAYGRGISVDGSGSIYTVGFHDPPAPVEQSYLAKRTSNGSVVWEKSLAIRDAFHKVAADSSGDAYVAGNFLNTITLEGTNFHATSQDILLARFSTNGTLQWAKQLGGPNSQQVNSLITDGTGNPILCGNFSGDATFGTNFLTVAPLCCDQFVAEYTSNGDLNWATNSGFAQSIAHSIAEDAEGNLLLTGSRQGSLVFMKLDQTGSLQWRFTRANGNGVGISAGPTGRVVATGIFSGSEGFDAITVTNRGGNDLFVCRVEEDIAPAVLGFSVSPTRFLRAGATATLNVNARSISPLSYRWFFNGAPIEGATGNIYQIAAAQPGHSGNYSAAVSNEFGVTITTNILLEVQPLLITGQWDFDDTNLAATIGTALEFWGDVESSTRFTNVFIDGREARVMQFPACSPTQGYLMPHGALPNAGGTKVNEWTLLLDLYFANASSGQNASLMQIDSLVNTNVGEVYLRWTNNGLGNISTLTAQYPTNIAVRTGSWHRVALAMSMLQGSGGILTRYIDGQRVGDLQAFAGQRDGTYALLPHALLFTDNAGRTLSGMVNSIQMRNYKMTDQEVAALGRARAVGIPFLTLTPVSTTSNKIELRVSRSDAAPLTEMPTGHQIYATTDLAQPLQQWTKVTNELELGPGYLKLTENTSGTRFYTIGRD